MSNLTTTALTSKVAGGNWSKAVQDLYTVELEPQVFKKLFQTYGKGFEANDFIDACGYVGTVAARTLTTLEEGAPERVVTLGAAIGTGAAGATISFTLDAGDYDSNGASIIRDGDEILIPAAYQTAGEDRLYRLVRSGSAGAYTYTGTPYANGTDVTKSQIGTLIPAGTELILVSSTHGIGTGQPEGKTNGLYSYTHYTKIIKDSFGLEGGQLEFARYTDNMEGVDWTSQEARAYMQMMFSMRSKIGASIFKSELNDNTSTLVATSQFGGSNAIPSFYGIWDLALKRAQKLDYVTNVTWDDVADIRVAFLSQGVQTSECSWLVGHKLNRDLEDLGLDLTKEFSGGTDLTRGLDKFGISYKKFQRNGLDITLAELASLSNPLKFGNDSYTFAESGLVIPTNQVAVTNAATGAKVKLDHFMKLDFAKDGRSRGMLMGTAAGLNELGYPVTNQYDGFNTYVLSEFMLASAAVNQIVLVRPA